MHLVIQELSVASLRNFPLKQRKQIWWQTSWLLTKRDRGVKLGTTEKQIQLVEVAGRITTPAP